MSSLVQLVIYLVGFLITWPIATRCLYEPMGNEFGDAWDSKTSTAAGGFAIAVFWPLAATALLVWGIFTLVGRLVLR